MNHWQLLTLGRVRGRAYRTCCLAMVITVSACVTAPQETVVLSEIVGEQIAELQSSHEAFVRYYYARLRGEVEQFLTKEDR